MFKGPHSALFLMILNKDDALFSIIAIMVSIVFILTVLGIVVNPKIGYGLSTNISINDTINVDEYVRINVTVNNTGYLLSSTKVTVRFYNITILNDNYPIIEKGNYSEITIIYNLKTGDTKEKQVELAFLPKENAINLVLYVYAAKNYSSDLIQNYGTSFSVITLTGKNVLLLNKEGDVYKKGGQAEFNELLQTYPNLLNR
jgi:hypothetical protein